MLLPLILVIAVFLIVNSSTAIKRDEDDELFRALDQELEQFLEKALDEETQKLDNFVLQNVDGSGEVPTSTDSELTTITTDSLQNIATLVETSTKLPNETLIADAKQLNASDASILLQMLSSVALTHLPIDPGVGAVVDRIISEVLDEEVRHIFAKKTNTLSSPSMSPSTTAVTLSSTAEIQTTTASTTQIQTTTYSTVEVQTTSPSTTPIQTTPSTTQIQTTPSSTTQIQTTTYSTVEVQTTSPSTAPIQTTPSSTTEIPTTTRPSLPIDVADFSIDKRKSCVKDTVCYSDSECGKGQCRGASLGKCNCHACVTNLPCIDDNDCGGLHMSCRNGKCRCAQALAKHGFSLFIVAMTNFCSQRTCRIDSDSCFGLPCNFGVCKCN